MSQQYSLQTRALAALALLAVTAIWGMTFTVMKNAYLYITPLFFLSCRFGLGSMALFCLSVRKWRKINRQLLLDSIKLGLPLFFGFALQSYGLTKTSICNAAFISGAYVIFVPLLGALIFRSKISFAQKIITVVVFIGLGFFSINEGFSFALGDILAFLAAFCYGMNMLLLDRYADKYDATLLNTCQLAVLAVLGIISALILEPLPAVTDFNIEVLFAIGYTALLGAALAFYVQTRVQRILLPSQTSVLITAEGIFGSIFGWIFLSEAISLKQGIGATIMIGCMVATVLTKGKSRKDNDPYAKETLSVEPEGEKVTL